MVTNNTKYNFLKGGGEMGKLIRDTDWSQTPLGEPKTWPQPLRTMVNVMLDNPLGMCIVWGNNHTQIYNDGYHTILGDTKHPQALGLNLKETFSEKWHIIQSLFEDAMNGKAVTLNDFRLELNRNDHVETCYFNFAYSPIRLENGEVGGVFITVTEITPQKRIQDKLKDTKDELDFVIDTAQLGTFDFNPLTKNFSSNYRLKEWFGLQDDNQIDLGHAINIIAERDRESVSEAIKEALNYSSGGCYDVKFSIINPSSRKEIIIHAKGRAWFNEDRIAYRLNGTLDDISKQTFAKDILFSENNLKLMILQAPVAIAIFRGPEYRVEIANKFALKIWGRSEDQVLNLPLFDVMPELLSQGIKEHLDDVIKTGNRFATQEMPVRIVRQDVLETVYINFSFEALYDGEGIINGIIALGIDVTNQVEARKKVEESEQSIRALVESAPFPIGVYQGEEMRIALANQSILDIWGKGNDVVGKLYSDILPELKNQKIFDQIREVLNTGIPFHAKNQKVHLEKNGKLIPYYFNYYFTPLFDVSGSAYAVMSTAAEVTELNKAKQDVEENEEKLKLIIEASELGIWDLDLKTDDMAASERCYEILGFPNYKNLTAENIITRVHPDDIAIRTKAFEKAFEKGFLHYQIRIIWEDQSLHWKDVKGKVFYDEDNKPVRMLGTVRDITEERNFHQQLMEREEKFRLLADSMPQHIWTADPEGNINYFNQSVYDYSGLTPQQLKQDGWIQIVHPDDREENIKQWNQAISTGKDFLFEQRFHKHDGEYRWQLSRAIPQKDADGVIKMWVGTSTDIQEQKMFTTELENMVQERTNELHEKNVDLEKMNKELQSFVYISSHDLQEPLRKIQTFASRIIEKEYETLSENAKKHFARMQHSAYRMQELIKDLIAYSRTNAQDIQFEIVNLEDIIDDVKETLSEELELIDVTIKVNNRAKIKIIPVQFNQVILNLATNSIKFSKPDQPIVIEIDCDKVKGKDTGIELLSDKMDYCHIRFADNGIGFEQQYKEKIFDVFQRLHSKDEYTGTGIGLAIVKRIIENHEGIIIANSNLDQGATFDIYIPAQ